jgi:uncharacterized protein (DUF1330 family)
MTRFGSYVVTWADEDLALPPPDRIDGLANAAKARSGRLLALGPMNDSSEQSSRGVPSWIAVAGFADEDRAAKWFDDVTDQLGGTTVLAPGLAEPVWWPPELEDKRPDWSQQHLDPPPERCGVYVTVWTDITDPQVFTDYVEHFKWTVECDGGVGLASGALPKILAGGPGPHAIALMSWPADHVARRSWYDGTHYLPYKQQRQRSSNSTIASVNALAFS